MLINPSVLWSTAINKRLNITPLEPYIGALVENVELAKPVRRWSIRASVSALLKHQVLFFHNQPYHTPLQQSDLAGRFGDLHIHSVYRTSLIWQKLSC